MKFFFSFWVAIILTGCGSSQYVLFQDSTQSKTEESPQATKYQVEKTKKITYEYKIAPQDRLSILVYRHPELSTRSNTGTVSANEKGVQVLSDGTINMPLIESVKVQGLTAKGASKQIERKLSKYIKKPYVNVEIINKRIYVLGEVNKPGMLPLDKDSINIVEALSASGGLTIYAQRDNIKILRGDLHHPQITTIDLTKLDALRVANIMIQPNDIIYIQPNSARAANIAIGEATPALGVVNTIISSFVNIKYLSN